MQHSGDKNHHGCPFERFSLRSHRCGPGDCAVLCGIFKQRRPSGHEEPGQRGEADIATLPAIGLTAIGEGEAYYQNQRMESAKALELAGLEPLKLGPKDGLGIVSSNAREPLSQPWESLRRNSLLSVTEGYSAWRLRG